MGERVDVPEVGLMFLEGGFQLAGGGIAGGFLNEFAAGGDAGVYGEDVSGAGVWRGTGIVGVEGRRTYLPPSLPILS